MDKIILANKSIGETPLDVIKKLKTENLKLQNVKMAYSGRLDPMAEGLMLILVGDECKNRNKYEKLSKEYAFEVLFNVSTDSYDLLGKITNYTYIEIKDLNTKLKSLIPTFIKTFRQKYPPYSAARVNGKALYYWARAGKLDSIKIPSKKVEIYSLNLIDFQTVSKKELAKKVFAKLNLVHGNFRQDEIKSIWQKYFEQTNKNEFKLAKFKISCSQGTYVRSLANEMGKTLKTPTLAFSIKRTKIGKCSLASLPK